MNRQTENSSILVAILVILCDTSVAWGIGLYLSLFSHQIDIIFLAMIIDTIASREIKSGSNENLSVI